MRPTWVEVDLEAVRANAAALRRAAGKPIMAVVKAEAYGHGALPVARAAREGGAVAFGVATVAEALALRAGGLGEPVLVLGYADPSEAETAARHDVRLALAHPEVARAYGRVAPGLGVHVKVDTGMGRFGVRPEEATGLVREALAAGLRIEGVFTHFAAADSDPVFTHLQLAAFREVVAALRPLLPEPVLVHAENSAALLGGVMPEADLARAGIALYGLAPDGVGRRPAGLRPALAWKAKVGHLKWVRAGESVGYGRTFRAERATLVATLPLGYADGYRRSLSNRGEVLVRGRRCPVVGRVSMDQVTVALREELAPVLGEEVVLLGAQGSDEVSAEELAAKAETINYEIVAGISPRVPRRYLGGR